MFKRNKGLNRLALFAILVAFGFIFLKKLAPLGEVLGARKPKGVPFSCASPYITDGDTIHCGERKVRLNGIDAPEMDGHCKQGRTCVEGDPVAAKSYLQSIANGTLECLDLGSDKYGRTIALCKNGKKDLSCEMIKSGHAIPRYAKLECE